jgi:hypothetical protein
MSILIDTHEHQQYPNTLLRTQQDCCAHNLKQYENMRVRQMSALTSTITGAPVAIVGRTSPVTA